MRYYNLDDKEKNIKDLISESFKDEMFIPSKDLINNTLEKVSNIERKTNKSKSLFKLKLALIPVGAIAFYFLIIFSSFNMGGVKKDSNLAEMGDDYYQNDSDSVSESNSDCSKDDFKDDFKGEYEDIISIKSLIMPIEEITSITIEKFISDSKDENETINIHKSFIESYIENLDLAEYVHSRDRGEGYKDLIKIRIKDLYDNENTLTLNELGLIQIESSLGETVSITYIKTKNIDKFIENASNYLK